MSREKRICFMAGSLLAASTDLDVRRALLVAGLIVDLIIKIQETGISSRRLLVGRLS
jgi:hypothetical protein